MKKIILLAIMLGLVGCGENGSSDVASPTNNQSTELTSNNIQQASARSISTYSMTVPFDGWHLFNPKALGASALYEGIKDALTSSAVLTADASQVAKVLGKGVAGYALSIAVEELLGAVDWVLDPANNQIIYYVEPAYPSCRFLSYVSLNRMDLASCSLQGAFENYATAVYGKTSLINYKDFSLTHCTAINTDPSNSGSASGKCFFTMVNKSTGAITSTYENINATGNPNYTTEKEKKTLSLETVAQKVIENADAGSLDAQVATMAAAAQILEDAANDEEIEQEIVDDLEANANNCDPRKGENCPPECDPPAGVKFDKVTHYEKHGRNPDPNIGTHGCMAKTGSPVHWHYHVNNQLPDGRCIRGRYFGGCGEAP